MFTFPLLDRSSLAIRVDLIYVKSPASMVNLCSNNPTIILSTRIWFVLVSPVYISLLFRSSLAGKTLQLFLENLNFCLKVSEFYSRKHKRIKLLVNIISKGNWIIFRSFCIVCRLVGYRMFLKYGSIPGINPWTERGIHGILCAQFECEIITFRTIKIKSKYFYIYIYLL